jgi:hypothetical protein
MPFSSWKEKTGAILIKTTATSATAMYIQGRHAM